MITTNGRLRLLWHEAILRSPGQSRGPLRSATESVHRDIYLLTSQDHGQTFQGRRLHQWDINACPMSSMDFAGNGKSVIAAWETSGQIYWTRIGPDGPIGDTIAAPGEGKGRKHPRVALSASGELLLTWTEVTGWQKGGSLAWQVYSRSGQPTGETKRLPGIPTWSFSATIADAKRGFAVLY